VRAPSGWLPAAHRSGSGVRAARSAAWPVGAAAALLLNACGSRAAPPVGEPETEVTVARDGYRAEFDMSWRGHPAGEAVEELVERGGGLRFARRERWRLLRGGSPVERQIEIVIDTDRELRGERIAVYRDGALHGRARRERGRWLIEEAGQARLAPRGAEPAELVLHRRARGQRWAGPVLLAGFDFAVARLEIEPAGQRERRVTLVGPAGRVESRVQLRADGTVERAWGQDLSARRRDEGAPSPALEMPPDMIELGAIAVGGRPGSAAIALELEPGPERAHPPAIPGQRIRRTARGWLIDLGVESTGAWPPLSIPDPPPGPALEAMAARAVAGAADPLAELRALARATSARLEDDLSVGPISVAAEAIAAGRADCVGHAVLFSALARARGFQIRLVTGYRLDRRRLTRHVWALVRVGRELVAIDPTFGEAPAAPGHHVGLAAHGSAPGEIALAAELAFAGLSGARARFVGRSSGASAAQPVE